MPLMNVQNMRIVAESFFPREVDITQTVLPDANNVAFSFFFYCLRHKALPVNFTGRV